MKDRAIAWWAQTLSSLWASCSLFWFVSSQTVPFMKESGHQGFPQGEDEAERKANFRWIVS